MSLMPPKPNLTRGAPEDFARLNDRLVEAARYALLRRLAPALRHDIAGALQPLGMMTAVLEKRLQQPQPDIAALMKNSVSIGKLVREASGVCMKLPAWLEPRDDAKVSVRSGVNESIRLMSTNLMMRGFTIDMLSPVEASASPTDADVSAGALRQVFCCSLLALTDAAQAPARVYFELRQSNSDVSISIHFEPLAGEEPGTGITSYRGLEWDDMQLLAAAEGVGLKRLADGAELKFKI